MDAVKALLTRRSIRKYTDEPVSDETLDLLLKVAEAAPTAAGPIRHFIIIKNKSTMEAVTGFHPHAEMLRTASAALAVCADVAGESLKGRWPMDCAAAMENILIAAHALGLGACWVGIHPVEERITSLRRLLGIPENVIPLAMVSLGMPAETKAPSNRLRPNHVHKEKW